jgi:hypothetical protein
VNERRTDRREEARARLEAIEAALARLEKVTADSAFPEDLVQPLKTQYEARLKHFDRRTGVDSAPSKRTDELEFLMIAAERERINELHRAGRLKDEGRRRVELELDLLAAMLSNHQHSE